MKIKRFLLMLFIVVSVLLFSNNVLALEEKGTFTELQLLINENTDGKLILEKDYTNNGSEPQITISKDIILDLNGHIINGRYVNRIFYVSNNAHLTIDDSNKSAIHKFDVDEWLLATLNETDGEVTVNGGCITAGDVSSGKTNGTRRYGKGSAIYVNSGSLTIISGNIIGNKISDKFQYGAGIAAENNSKVTIKGGMVSYNRATWEGYGGGIYLNNSDLIIDGGTISYNYGIYGGGINAYDASSVTMNGGNISNNIAGHNGAGIALMVYDQNIPLGYVSKATINGGVIENNTVVTPLIGVGGGISTNKSTDLTINGGTIQKNKAARGAGVGAWTGGDIKIYGGVIKENISTEDTTPLDGSTGNYGAGVFFNTYFIGGYGSVDANLTIGGSAIITGNINDVTKKEDNLFLANDQTINIGANEYSPTNKMNVGITMETPGVFSSNVTSDYTDYFKSDVDNYYIKKDNNDLKLVLDTEVPTGEIIVKENSFKTLLNNITFGLFFKETVNVTINASDDVGIKSIEYIISAEEKTLSELQTITSWTKYEPFSIELEDKYIIYAKITDKADKVIYISSNGFIIDKTLPLVTGIENNKIYYTTIKFNVNDINMDKVLVNEVEVSEYILPGNMDKTYEIDIFDKAENKLSISVKMMPISTISDLIDELNIENVKFTDKDDIEYVIDKVNSIDLTNATLEEKEELQKIVDKCDLLLEAIKNKYISKVDLTLTMPRVGQTVENNTFEITSSYDNIIFNIKGWKIYGKSEVLSDDYVFEDNIIYIPILEIEVKNKTHYFDENTTLSVHGSTWSNKEEAYSLKKYKDNGYVKDLSYELFLIDEMTVEAVKYDFIFGANQTYITNKNKELLFEIDADYSLFEGKVYVDDILLDQKDYSSEKGSTIIKLKKDYIDSLKVGKHTLKVEFNDGGEAITNFVIDVLKEEKNPKTGDNITSYLIIGSLSLISLFGSCLYLNRKRFN